MSKLCSTKLEEIEIESSFDNQIFQPVYLANVQKYADNNQDTHYLEIYYKFYMQDNYLPVARLDVTDKISEFTKSISLKKFVDSYYDKKYVSEFINFLGLSDSFFNVTHFLSTFYETADLFFKESNTYWFITDVQIQTDNILVDFTYFDGKQETEYTEQFSKIKHKQAEQLYFFFKKTPQYCYGEGYDEKKIPMFDDLYSVFEYAELPIISVYSKDDKLVAQSIFGDLEEEQDEIDIYNRGEEELFKYAYQDVHVDYETMKDRLPTN